MGEAYTPGLKVKERTLIRRIRRLPLPGEILKKPGDKVFPNTIVARVMMPGDIEIIRAHPLLGVDADEVSQYMVKNIGDKLEKGDILAKYNAFFGLFKKRVYSPIKGSIEMVSDVTGRITLRGEPIPVEINAYIHGEIIKVFPEVGVEIGTPASFIQGIFGIGGEAHGELTTITKSPEDILEEGHIGLEHKGKILIGGSLVTSDALIKAEKTGVKGIIVGGIDSKDLTDFIGYDIGVAITGNENIRTTVVITEGFSKMKMAERTFNLLKSHEGRQASMNGATQIRAGVIRPEIIIPLEEPSITRTEIEEELTKGIEPGTLIRVIKEPHFGALGKVVSLPPELRRIETESEVRVLEAELENIGRVIIPRANVELFVS